MANAGTLDRGLQVIAFIANAKTASLKDVAASLSMPFSTVHRIVQTLMASGYVIRLGRGRYTLGPMIFALASGASFNKMLIDISRPILAKLARQCRACAHLGIFDEEMVTYLIKHSFGRNRIFSTEGMQLEAYCSAVGKVLLAYLPSADRERYLSGGSFIGLTPHTIIDPHLLNEELRQVRGRGWAIDNEEIMAGLRCVAAPIIDADGNVIAALSVSGEIRCVDYDSLLDMLPFVQAAAQHIHERLYIVS